jgi:hypothetical protein
MFSRLSFIDNTNVEQIIDTTKFICKFFLKKILKNIWWFEFNSLYLYSKLIKMTITEFNEMYFEMVNLLEWVNKYYVADTKDTTIPLQFHRMADNNWGANPYTPEQVVNEYMKQVWIRKKDEK